MIQFKNVSSITALIWFVLFIVLLVTPQVIFILFNIQEHESAIFLSRRAAMLFLGLSIIIWASRNSVHSDTRQAICIGAAVSMLALAVLGTIEYLRSFVGLGIFLAVVTEVAIGTAYLKIWFDNKNT